MVRWVLKVLKASMAWQARWVPMDRAEKKAIKGSPVPPDCLVQLVSEAQKVL